MNVGVQTYAHVPAVNTLGIYLELELLGHMVCLCLNFGGVTYRFAPFCVPTINARVPQFFHFLANICIFCFLFFFVTNPNECKVVFHCGLDLIALMVSGVEYCFMCILAMIFENRSSLVLSIRREAGIRIHGSLKLPFSREFSDTLTLYGLVLRF